MKFLLVAKQKKNIDTFQDVIAALLRGGHAVTLAIQQRDDERDRGLAGRFDGDFELASCPEGRGDRWRAAAPLVRSVRDWAQYLRPAYRHTTKLRQRSLDRLAKTLGAEQALDADGLTVGAAAAQRVHETLALVEHAIPSDPLHDEFLARHAPDVVLVTPGLHFGSAQADFVKSARARGIPVWMLLFSWDNLSTKGAIHVAPDLMFVWNERQRDEAAALHDFPPDRVVIAGAPRFDEFFALRSVVSREAFFAPLGLDPSRPTLLYVCSSRFIAARELTFIRRWLRALRESAPPLSTCNVIVRPHPDIPLVDDEEPREITWRGLPQTTGWVQRPFDDAAALVLRTTFRPPQVFFECLHHAEAVVGLNTSAELEAGIAGRPVFTVVADEQGADGQRNTLHFDYLLDEQGGFVTCAPDVATHLSQVQDALTTPPQADRIRAAVMRFLRPGGDRPVAPFLAGELVRHASSAAALSRTPAAAPASMPAEDAAADPQAGVLRVGSPASATQVYATPETRRRRKDNVLSIEPAVLAWLNERVQPGDVLYDVGAGVGAHAIYAAVQRGALAVALEPGFAAFERLCRNVLLNECGQRVVPLPIAVGDRAGLFELAYPHDAGSDVHALRFRKWRTGSDAPRSHYAQPVCAERLDDLVARYRLPAPTAIRVAVRKDAGTVLQGAASLLRSSRLHSVIVVVSEASEEADIAAAIEGLGFGLSQSPGADERGAVLLLARTGPATARAFPIEVLRRTSNRVRRLW